MAADRYAAAFEKQEPWVQKNENYRPPGYQGFIPRARFHSGHSFAKVTDMARQEFQQTQQHLQTVHVQKPPSAPRPGPTIAHSQSAPVKLSAPLPRPPPSNPQSRSTWNLESSHKPWESADNFRTTGYSGYIPRMKHMSGKAFTTMARRAIEEFHNPASEAEHERQIQVESLKYREAKFSEQLYQFNQTTRNMRSQQIGSALKSGSVPVPERVLQSETSKHPLAADMVVDQPKGKFHIRGYKGFIPGAQFLSGESFSRMSEQAFSGKHTTQLNLSDQPTLRFPQPMNPGYVKMLEKHRSAHEEVKIGHVLGYQGFVPERADKVGVSFSRATLPPNTSS